MVINIYLNDLNFYDLNDLYILLRLKVFFLFLTFLNDFNTITLNHDYYMIFYF